MLYTLYNHAAARSMRKAQNYKDTGDEGLSYLTKKNAEMIGYNNNIIGLQTTPEK